MTECLLKRLTQRRASENFRQLHPNKNLIDFVSNDYLGLARSEELYHKINGYDLSHCINKNGSTGSRLLAGNTDHYIELESKLAGIFKSEAALLFNSGYNANLALVSSIPQKGDTILYDGLSHVCLKEGAWLSRADSISFRHNDLADLERKLKRTKSRGGAIYIITESVYSMDGDKAPLADICKLSRAYKACLIVDEAHGTGVFGDAGSGLVCQWGLQQEFLARVYTFGKGMGVHGACVCGSQDLIDYLINFGRPFIYTTALPIHEIISIDASFDYLNKNIRLQKQLQERIDYFNAQYQLQLSSFEAIEKPFSDTAIQPIIIPGNNRIKNICRQLQHQGLDVRPILPPTVKAGTERLRISLHTHNSKEEIDKLITELKSALAKQPI